MQSCHTRRRSRYVSIIVLFLCITILQCTGRSPLEPGPGDYCPGPADDSDVIARVKAAFPEVSEIERAGWIGDYIYTFHGSSGWELVFQHGWGDCPSGCIYMRFYYFLCDAASDTVRALGEYGSNDAGGVDGTPRWDIPWRGDTSADQWSYESGTGTLRVRAVVKHLYYFDLIEKLRLVLDSDHEDDLTYDFSVRADSSIYGEVTGIPVGAREMHVLLLSAAGDTLRKCGVFLLRVKNDTYDFGEIYACDRETCSSSPIVLVSCTGAAWNYVTTSVGVWLRSSPAGDSARKLAEAAGCEPDPRTCSELLTDTYYCTYARNCSNPYEETIRTFAESDSVILVEPRW